MNELLERFFNLSKQEQKEVLMRMIEVGWSDDIAGDLGTELKDYEQ